MNRMEPRYYWCDDCGIGFGVIRLSETMQPPVCLLCGKPLEEILNEKDMEPLLVAHAVVSGESRFER